MGNVAAGVGLTAATVTYLSHYVGGWASALGTSGKKMCRQHLPGWGAGKVVIVTGGSAGIGLQTAAELAAAGATVVLACRSVSKGERARASMNLAPDAAARTHVMELDLASLKSVVSFAKAFQQAYARLDVLLLNAGIAGTMLGNSGFKLTVDGLEEMMGVNFLGHYLLTGLLLPTLRKTEGCRVVGLSSIAQFNSYLRGVDPQSWTKRPRDFADWKQYGQSKLAMRLFMGELQKREPSLLAVSCHPSVAHSGLLDTTGGLIERVYQYLLFALFGMHPRDSHLTVLYLATAPATVLEGGACYEPMVKKMVRQRDRVQRILALQSPGGQAFEHPALWDAAREVLNQRTKEAMGQEFLPA